MKPPLRQALGTDLRRVGRAAQLRHCLSGRLGPCATVLTARSTSRHALQGPAERAAALDLHPACWGWARQEEHAHPEKKEHMDPLSAAWSHGIEALTNGSLPSMLRPEPRAGAPAH